MSSSRFASPPSLDTFGEFLKYLRLRADLSQTGLGTRCGYSSSHISRLENNKLPPDKVKLEALFVPALGLGNQPELVVQLLKLADEAQGKIQAASSTSRQSESTLYGANGILEHQHLSAQQTQFLAQVPNNLFVEIDPFIGRESERLGLVKLLKDPTVRLATIVGIGGIGKTRIALDIAMTQLNNFPDGVYFVSFAALNSPDFIVSTIAKAIGITFDQNRDYKQQLLDYLRDKRILLILDNLEHLLAGVGIVIEILQVSAAVKILATSRERLNLQGETLFRVEGMDFPSLNTNGEVVNCSSVMLFIRGARRIQPFFTPSTEDLAYIAQICCYVQGMPLAILIAIGLMEALSLSEIASQIMEDYGFLVTQERDVPLRQRSIRAVFDHSWQLLLPIEQNVFKTLSVFQGSFTQEAAQAVAGISLQILITLINKSFLRRAPNGRYDIHKLLRQYASSKLNESGMEHEAAQDLHCEYYAALMEKQEPLLSSEKQLQALQTIEQDFDNVGKAWEWAAAKQNEPKIRQILISLQIYIGERRSITEAQVLYQQAINSLNGSEYKKSITYGLLLTFKGHSYNLQGERERSHTTLQQGLSILRQHICPRETAAALVYLARASDDSTERINLRNEGIALIWTSIDQWPGWVLLDTMTTHTEYRSDVIGTDQFFKDIVDLGRRTGNRFLSAVALRRLGFIARDEGSYDEARQYFEDTLRLRQELKSTNEVAAVLYDLAYVDYLQKRYDAAEVRWQEALVLYRELGNRWRSTDCLSVLANVAYARGNYMSARQVFEEILVTYREIGTPGVIANALNNLGHPMAALGDYVEAGRCFREALDLALNAGILLYALESLEGIANILGETGQKERAVEILAFALHQAANTMDIRQLGEAFLAKLRNDVPQEIFTNAQNRGKSLNLEEIVSHLAHLPE